MWHPFPGFSGTLLGFLILVGIWSASYFTKEFKSYNLDPKAKPGAFDPLLAKYIRAAEFIIGLATGSIVLLIGSYALHAQGGRLPWFYASPLPLLGWCVIYGVAFIVWLIHSYEEYQHDNPHTKCSYSIRRPLGFTPFPCSWIFC